MGSFVQTLCWDCANATGGCSWSDYGMPIEGWTAKEVQKSSSKPYQTYQITACPLFIRNAYDGGLKRIKGETK